MNCFNGIAAVPKPFRNALASCPVSCLVFGLTVVQVQEPRGHLRSHTDRDILRNAPHRGLSVHGRHRKGDTRVKPLEGRTVVRGRWGPRAATEVFGQPQKAIGWTAPPYPAGLVPKQSTL